MGASSHQPPTPLQPQINLAPQLTSAGEEKDSHTLRIDEFGKFSSNRVSHLSAAAHRAALDSASPNWWLLHPNAASSTVGQRRQRNCNRARGHSHRRLPRPAARHRHLRRQPVHFRTRIQTPHDDAIVDARNHEVCRASVNFGLNCPASEPSTLSAPVCLCLAAFNCSWRSSESNKWAI